MDSLFDTVTGNLLVKEGDDGEAEDAKSKKSNDSEHEKLKIENDEEKNVLIQDPEDYIESFI